MASSFAQHFQDAYHSSNNKVGYIRAHYDVSGFCNGTVIKGGNGNILNRLRNELVRAINEQPLLPRAIVVVLDDDVIDAFNHYIYGFSKSVGRIAERLGNQFHQIVSAHKEKLPSKSRKFKFPTIL